MAQAHLQRQMCADSLRVIVSVSQNIWERELQVCGGNKTHTNARAENRYITRSLISVATLVMRGDCCVHLDLFGFTDCF